MGNPKNILFSDIKIIYRYMKQLNIKVEQLVHLQARNSEISLEKERIILGSGLELPGSREIFFQYIEGVFKVGKIKIKNEENIRIIKRYILELAGKNQLGWWQGEEKHDTVRLDIF